MRCISQSFQYPHTFCQSMFVSFQNKSRNQRLSSPLTDSLTLWSHECLSLALGTNRRRRDCVSAEIRMEDVGFDVQSFFEVNPCGQLHDREMLHCRRRFDSTFWPKARVVVFACFPLPGAHCSSGTPQVWDGWSRNISCVEKRCVFFWDPLICVSEILMFRVGVVNCLIRSSTDICFCSFVCCVISPQGKSDPCKQRSNRTSEHSLSFSRFIHRTMWSSE